MKNKFNILLISLIISVFYPQDKIDPVYTGSFGSVTINWNGGPDDPNDPSIGSNWGKTSIKLTLP